MPAPGKLEIDLKMQDELRVVGDGHNADAPAFQQFRLDLLAQYDATRLEDLPVNFRGIVAEVAEEGLTEVFNKYAEERMGREAEQARFAAAFGWLSPVMAASAGSRALSGTDLATHHRFLREAEAVRFDFVQGLNRVHIEQLAYSDDISRNINQESSQRTRMSSENWKVLDEFSFQPDATGDRLARAGMPITMLIVWLLVLILGGLFAARRMRS